MKNIINTPLLNRKFVMDRPETFKLDGDSWDRPEKVIQFGTGVLLRGLVDYTIDKANKAKLFNGNVVIVKSTDNAIANFQEQDNFYTVLEKGRRQVSIIENKHLITCVSRVLSANLKWDAILQCAATPSIEIAVSNTTEAGLVFVEENLNHEIPKSYPAKLTAYLWYRYNAFQGDVNKGMVILPTELRSNNGQLLKDFVMRHARKNNLGSTFLDWLHNCNHFCNTLVDRIVPGKSEKDDIVMWNDQLAYTDHLHTMTEPFLLWAIEGGGIIREKLPFTEIDERIIITDNIGEYEEQKLRILNGSNSVVVSPAFLAGCDTLLDTVEDNLFAQFTSRLIDEEIIPTIVDRCPNASVFAKEVLDRFGNPFVEYDLLNIALQCSSKMNSRNADTIIGYYHLYYRYPPLMMIGLASFFLFYTPKGKDSDGYFGLRNGVPYPFRDEHTEFLCGILEGVDWHDPNEGTNRIRKIMENDQVFSHTLASLPKLSDILGTVCAELQVQGIRNTVELYLDRK